ncbi:hypothetical protein SLEP1_g29500 [Rubroshorea leprosula]|uniref:RNase H type-1 domain-containing protein n=1 Tax=Rubroshorea leprosula TaxID=152421 RepID=A0AAV5K749_9ROSI|nr:hypothetical protein SLEP1_g29500 [Rubroshorea leprosula]
MSDTANQTPNPQEADLLIRSVKRIKGDGNPPIAEEYQLYEAPPKQLSYIDMVSCLEPAAILCDSSNREEILDKDSDHEDDGIKAQWKPRGKMDCIDLGLDFFLIRFHEKEDLNRVLHGGPWFVGPHFLTIRKWEPSFDPAKATFTITAIWARLPRLPIEYYDVQILERIGNMLVDLDEPLVPFVCIGKHVQKVLYEGPAALCYSCGCVGYKEDNCPLKVPQPMAISNEQNIEAQTSQASVDGNCNEPPENQGFGPWMLVERRKNKKKVNSNHLSHSASRLTGTRNGSQVPNSKGNVIFNIAINVVTVNSNGSNAAIQPSNSISKAHNSSSSPLAQDGDVNNTPAHRFHCHHLWHVERLPLLKNLVPNRKSHKMSRIILSRNQPPPLELRIMDAITFTKLSHLWDVLLINRNNQAIPIEKALSLVLNKNLKSIKGWTLETIQNCWLNPILTMKGVDPTHFLPPPMEGIPLPLEHLSLDSCILQKAVWSSLAEIVRWDDWSELIAPKRFMLLVNMVVLSKEGQPKWLQDLARAANQEFKRNAMDIINQHNPVDSDGFAGGIWLMWDDTKYTIDILNVGPQAIHANVLNINQEKSKILFSANVNLDIRLAICHTLGYMETPSLGKYLGFPITSRRIEKSDCNFIVDKVRSKLARWKANMLSLVGRVTFVTSVLSSIPNYYMQGMFFPASIHKELDTISRNFIWGSTSTKRKANLISWDRITQPRKAGGIGIRASSEVNQAAMAKLHWRMITEVQKPWAKAFISKYKIDPPYHNFSQSSSPICKDISKGKDIVEKGISWVPRDGSKINFWQDRWILKESLCSVFYGPFRPHDLDINVKDLLFPDGKWNFDAVAYPLPQDIIQKIVAIAFQRHSAEQDSFRWNSLANGKFSMKSTYFMAKNIQWTQMEDWSWIWNVCTIPKIKYFLWLVMHGRILTFDTLAQWGVVSDNRCPRCRNGPETLTHIFRECQHAAIFWNSIIPQSISTYNQNLDFKSWIKEFIRLQPALTTFQPKTIVFVGWSPPSPGFAKLNTYGFALTNPGIAGAGGSLCDHLGRWMVGFSRSIGWTTSIAAELWAIRDGLEIAAGKGISKLIVETDSKVVVLLIDSTYTTLHSLGTLISYCRLLLRLFTDARISHIYREANAATDFLAKLGSTNANDFVWYEESPPGLSSILYHDLIGTSFPRTIVAS